VYGQDAHPPRSAYPRPGDDRAQRRGLVRNLLWLDARKCLLLAHAGTLFSVFVPDIRKADLVPIGPSVVGFIHNELEAERFPLDRLGALDSRSIALAKTESRTVLGYMNEIDALLRIRGRRRWRPGPLRCPGVEP